MATDEERDQMLALLGLDVQTIDDLKSNILNVVQYRFEKNSEVMGLGDLSRQFNIEAKQFGGLKKVLGEMISDQVLELHMYNKARLFITSKMRELVEDHIKANPEDYDALNNLLASYKGCK